MVLKEFNREAFNAKAGDIWLNIEGEVLSFNEQVKRLQNLENWLNINKISKHELVLVGVDNALERVSLLVALISLGQPIIIFDPDATEYETNQTLMDCNFSAVIADKEIYNKLNLEGNNFPYLEVIKKNNKAGVFNRLLGSKKIIDDENTWPQLIENNELSKPNIKLGASQKSTEDIAYVIFTSGTTSKSKGVEIQYGALLSQLTTLKSHYGIDKNSRLLNTLPLHHVDGFIQGPVIAWYAGASLHRPCVFSAQYINNYLNSIYRERITHLIAVPTMLSLIHRLGLEFAENFESSDFEFVVSCAGHLELSLWESFEKDFNVKVVNMYGLTETVTSALFSGPDATSRFVGTLGMPINSEIKIVDDDGQTISGSEVGELYISSPQLMKGYHGDQLSSSQVLNNGWLASGDLVKKLNTGHIELVGRKKNQIISGGRNISPEEVSEVINLHADVAESVVLGLEDKDWGEIVGALVVATNKTVSSIELISWCRERLSEYKVPRFLFFVNELEKGPSGKILIPKAREELDQRMNLLSKNKTLDESTESKILTIASSVFRIQLDELTVLSSPENTEGWDSLAHMNFVLELERTFQIDLTTRDIMNINSIERAIEICDLKLEE